MRYISNFIFTFFPKRCLVNPTLFIKNSIFPTLIYVAIFIKYFIPIIICVFFFIGLSIYSWNNIYHTVSTVESFQKFIFRFLTSGRAGSSVWLLCCFKEMSLILISVCFIKMAEFSPMSFHIYEDHHIISPLSSIDVIHYLMDLLIFNSPFIPGMILTWS